MATSIPFFQATTAFVAPHHAAKCFSCSNNRQQRFIRNNRHVIHASPEPHEINRVIEILSTSPPHHNIISTPMPSFSTALLSSFPTLLTSVKVFDGSEITNAVVVSNSFWSTLSSKLPALLFAQVLASITFVLIASLVAAQGKFIIEQVASNVDKKRSFKKFSTARSPPTLDFTKLLICIIIDIIGSANEAIPVVGELVDIVYAPIAALLLRQLYSGSNVVFLLELVEEILPFTDILPLATICWVVETFFGGGDLARVLRIGDFAPENEFKTDVIDVDSNDKSSFTDANSKIVLQSDVNQNEINKK